MTVFNFDGYEITVVLSPVDFRCGFDRLNSIASIHCHINVVETRHVVVFVSRRSNVIKAIFSDDRGNNLLTRWLKKGHYERLLGKVNDKATMSLTREELISYLNADPIFEKKSTFYPRN